MVLLSVQPKAVTFALPNNARAGWCIPLGNTGLFCLFSFGGGPSLQPGESFDGHVLTKAMLILNSCSVLRVTSVRAALPARP